MAGLQPPNAIAARQKERQRPAPFAGKALVDASVSMGGRTFSTLIREGASAEELIEQVAKENGGGVAKVYYKEFDTWEIVAVKIGGELLVKGDPGRVAEADFSQFPDPQSTKAAAARASRLSEGGIHFSLGSAGIPIAVTEGQGIVFPNAEELRVGSATRKISLWMTSVSSDPLTIRDLRSDYRKKGGLAISEDALSKISKAHGGVRSEKLMLEENLLVLDKDTGDIMTARQFASSLPKDIAAGEGFVYSPPPSAGEAGSRAKHPQSLMQSPGTVMDAYPGRLPCLVVRTFERSLAELLTVRFNPIRADKAPEDRKRAAGSGFHVAVLGFAAREQEVSGAIPHPSKSIRSSRESPSGGPARSAEEPGPSTQKDSMPRAAFPLPSQIGRSWLRKRVERLMLGVPVSLNEAARSPATEMGGTAPKGHPMPSRLSPKAHAKNDDKKPPGQSPSALKTGKKPAGRGKRGRKRSKGRSPAGERKKAGPRAKAGEARKSLRKKLRRKIKAAAHPRPGSVKARLGRPRRNRPGKGPALTPAASKARKRRDSAHRGRRGTGMDAEAGRLSARRRRKTMGKRRRKGSLASPRRKKASARRDALLRGKPGGTAAPERRSKRRKKERGRVLGLLGLFKPQWKKRGRKLRMKKKRAP